MSDILTSFADDFSALESASTPAELETRLTEALEEIGAWADEAKLTVSSSKTTTTLFTPDPAEVNRHDPIVYLGQTRLPVERAPKILGVTFDPSFTFGKHVAAIEAKAKKRLQVLKALAGTSWGHSKETLIATYKAIIQPLFTYACPIWYPNTHSSHIEKLQRVQNAAMRVITGCHLMTSPAELQRETHLLPVDLHLRMLCQQFTASASDLLTPALQLCRHPSINYESELLKNKGTPSKTLRS